MHHIRKLRHICLITLLSFILHNQTALLFAAETASLPECIELYGTWNGILQLPNYGTQAVKVTIGQNECNITIQTNFHFPYSHYFTGYVEENYINDMSLLDRLSLGRNTIPVDLNNDTLRDSSDIISGLKILTGSGDISSSIEETDTNRDGKIGVADILFILQDILRN